MIGSEDYTLVIYFVSKGFPYEHQIEELFIVIVYCVYSQHVPLSTFLLISLFNCNILFKGTVFPICAETVIKPKSIKQSYIHLFPNYY